MQSTHSPHCPVAGAAVRRRKARHEKLLNPKALLIMWLLIPFRFFAQVLLFPAMKPDTTAATDGVAALSIVSPSSCPAMLPATACCQAHLCAVLWKGVE